MSFITDLKTAEAKIQTLVTYVPLVNSTVQQVEAAMPGASGTSKAQSALAIVLSVAHAGETVPNTEVQLISGIIDTVVSMLNSLGIFKKATAPTTTAVAAAPPAA